MSWHKVPIGELFTKKSSNRKQKDLLSHGYPVYGASGLSGFAEDFDVQVPYFSVVKDGAGVGRITAHPARSSVVGTMECLVPKPEFSFDYLGYCLRQIRFERYVTGSTIPHVYFKDYKNELVPVPPLEEQRRIAGILDEADLVRKKTQALIDKYDELAQSLFLDMFGDPVTNPKGWEVVTLGDMFEISKAKIAPEDIDNGASYVGLEHINSRGHYTPVNILKGDLKSTKSIFSSGQILFGRLRPYLRKTVLTSNSGICSTDILVIQPASLVSAMYITFFLRLDSTVRKATERCKGANLPRISSRDLIQFAIPSPPIAMQDEFNFKIRQIHRQVATLNTSQILSEEGFESLLQQAFNGKIK